MIAQELRHLADIAEQWATRPGVGFDDQFAMLGLSAELANLADRVAVLEGAGAMRLENLPAGVIDLAACRARLSPHHDGDHAA